MKRSDDGRIIKIPEIAAAKNVTPQQTSASIASVFPQRPSIVEMPQQPVVTVGGTLTPQLPTQAHRTGVTVFREPPAAHTGVVVTATPAQGVGVVQPPSASVIHGPPSSVAQPISNIKPEQISLPTAPVSLQFANTFPAAGSLANNVGPPASVKTLASAIPSSIGQSVQTIVHNLQQQQQQQQQQQHQPPTATTVQQVIPLKPANHQTINFTPSATLRPMSNVVSTLAPTAAASAPNNSISNANANNANNPNFQRLKVEDALSYLDQVKYKFGNQPQVYNDFLDIMKEFKSQSIDTPGVIARVSSLFRGHPELIVGFNTFLPPGYKIELKGNDSIAVSMPGSVGGTTVQTIVHTPHGIHHMTTQGSGPLTSTMIPIPNMPPMQQHLPQPQQPQQQQQQPPPPPTGNIIRMPLPTINTPPTVTATPINTPKFHPQQQPQHGIKIEASTGFHIGLPTTPIHPTNASAIPNAAAQAVAQVRHQIQQQHQQQQSGAAAAIVGTTSAAPVTQPVEFNHAINYVNKIKNRFQGQPDVYKQFLEILHTYQKDQKAIKEGHRPTGPYLTEAEVYAQVAKLFQNQEDLLAEFGQFLPEATGESSIMGKGVSNDNGTAKKLSPALANYKFGTQKFSGTGIPQPIGQSVSPAGGSIKRPTSGLVQPPPKKHKTGVLRDVSLAEAGKLGTLNEFAFFDKVRKALRNQEVYDNFLRCLVLFNQEVISRGELIQLTSPFLSRHSELFKWFKDFVGFREGGNNSGFSAEAEARRANSDNLDEDRNRNEAERSSRENFVGNAAVDIDYATCKRLGASYCALPKNFVQPSCSGRTSLCHQVLNDTWVSFPSWSEDSQFVTSRKTQYEEAIYRTEDERFEFDVVLETNKDTIKVLECVQKKMSRMPPEEAARYRLDDCLGGTSATVHQRAVRRIYGEKSGDIIEGLKRNPVVAVPLVLRRLRAKDEEWREVQKNFNKIWRDQNEKYYLKSLDHQSLQFKQNDVRTLRSKTLLSEIETLYDERHEHNDDTATSLTSQEGPHLTLNYQDLSILEDANNLLIHHVKRQTSIHKEDKHKIKVLLKHFLMDRFKHARQDLSDDEREDEDDSGKEEGDAESDPGKGASRGSKKKPSKDETSPSNKKEDAKESEDLDVKVEPKDGRRTPLHVRDMDPDETYTLFMANNNWYLFLRLHQILCDRLNKMYNQAIIITNEETKERKDRKESTAIALRLKPKNEIEPEDYYAAFIDMVKNLLDGNMDSQAYEDTLREMFGIHAYITFTLDKVVGNAVRQLQHLVTDESCVECYDLFIAESKNGGTGGNCGSAVDRQVAETVYQKKAEKLLADENCIKMILYHDSGNLTIELLDTDNEGHESDKDQAPRKVQSYADRFISGPDDELSIDAQRHLAVKPIFLPRSIRSFNTRSRARQIEARIRSRDADDKVAANNHVEDSEGADNERASLKQEDETDDDNAQCQFSRKNFKVLYIINSENCFYRRLALRRAAESHKTVSQRKFGEFSRWHAGWVRQNVADSAHQEIESWFTGKTDDLVPNRTQKVTRNCLDKTPYKLYNKYTVEISKTSPPPLSSS